MKVDTISAIESHAKAIVTVITKAEADDLEQGSILKNIQRVQERVLETCKVIREYRKLKAEAIYIYDTRDDEFRPASKSEKIKISRKLLEARGLIEGGEKAYIGSFTDKKA